MSTKMSLPGHYCWIRLISQRFLTGFPMKSTKPPKKTSYALGTLALRGQHEKAYFHIDMNAHKEGSMDYFDIGPAFASENEAISWADSDDGQKWLTESTNCVLVGFSPGNPPTFPLGTEK